MNLKQKPTSLSEAEERELQTILEELERRSSNVRSVRNFIEKNLYIIDQDSHLILLKLNKTQDYIMSIIEWLWERDIPVFIIILKARKEGVSTLIEAILFTKTIQENFVKSLVISYNDKATVQIYKIAERYYRHLPKGMRPPTKYYSKYGISFEGNFRGEHFESEMNIETAGNVDVGRGITINNIHLTESARMENLDKVLTSAIDATPEGNPNVLVASESTAKGQGNRFHTSWTNAVDFAEFKKMYEEGRIKGRPPFIRIFIPWFWDERYYTEPPKDFKLYNYDHDIYGNEKETFDRFSLKMGQMYWRRRKIESDEINNDLTKFMEEYPATEDEAFLAAGDTIFAPRRLQSLLAKTSDPIAVGKLKIIESLEDVYHHFGGVKPTVTFEKDPLGELKIWEYPVEKEKRKVIGKNGKEVEIEERIDYIVSGDVAEGTEVMQGKPDNSGLQVWKRTNPFKLVAEICGRIEPDILADKAYALGFYYNNGWIGVERNTYGVATNKRLQKELCYPFLYFRIIIDQKTDKKTKQFGWYSGKIERPIMITDFAALVRNDEVDIPGKEMVSEMKTFIRRTDGKIRASSMAWDDRVIMGMIAYQLHKIMPKVNFDMKIRRPRPSRGSVTGR